MLDKIGVALMLYVWACCIAGPFVVTYYFATQGKWFAIIVMWILLAAATARYLRR